MFRKAKPQQAALKLGVYGLAGSGKTFTSLLIAEGLAKLAGKRVAFVDTERGTDFYAQAVNDRPLHPEAFDFDALYTRSITEIADSIKGLPVDTYGVVVIDSITHVWEAAKAAYSGKTTRAGTLPFHAWSAIKKPYKDLMAFLLSSPLHVIFCGRQGNVFEENEETGEMKKVGEKMKAEGETAYEPHILIQMFSERRKDGSTVVSAFAEKDRTGVLSGKTFNNPTFETLIKPLIPLLGSIQAQIETEDATAGRDAEKIAERDAAKAEESAKLLKEYRAHLDLCKTKEEVKAIGKLITPEVKSRMTTADVADLRESYLATEAKFN